MRIAFVIPTRNRHDELARTLNRLASYNPALLADAPEIIIVDNASDQPVTAPRRLANNISVSVIHLDHNAGAAARNTAAHHTPADWLVMLDDDSSPIAGDIARLALSAPPELAAIGGEITLPTGNRESGGLPEVIIGCGCMIRRDAFISVGGYDAAFGYYAEEYDLCAKLIARAHRVTHTRAVHFEHRKVRHARSFDLILSRLVRNNGWTIARHAPEAQRDDALRAMLDRYRAIAIKEHAQNGYDQGIRELAATIDAQPHTPLTIAQWDRFIGIAACRNHLTPLLRKAHARTVSLISRGKGDDLIERVVRDSGCEVLPDGDTADLQVIATLSPGPMRDAIESNDAVPPWSMTERPTTVAMHAAPR